jgi:hypothetical protein
MFTPLTPVINVNILWTVMIEVQTYSQAVSGCDHKPIPLCLCPVRITKDRILRLLSSVQAIKSVRVHVTRTIWHHESSDP